MSRMLELLVGRRQDFVPTLEAFNYGLLLAVAQQQTAKVAAKHVVQ